jgi:hypothetical protein
VEVREGVRACPPVGRLGPGAWADGRLDSGRQRAIGIDVVSSHDHVQLGTSTDHGGVEVDLGPVPDDT